MPNHGTVAHLFELAISAEITMAKCYTSFADMFSHGPDIAARWKELAEDERNHKTALDAIRSSLDPETLAGTADATVLRHAEEVVNFPIAERIKAVKNLNDALELAHELEYSEVNSVFKFLSSEFIDPKKRSDFVLPEISEHLERLIRFSEDFGNAEQQRRVGIKGL